MTKVSVYIDDLVWTKFKEQVFQKHGTLRKISSEVELLLRASIVEDTLTSTLEKLGIKAKGTISSQQVKAARPQLSGPPSEEILAQMRQKRVVEALPRQ